MIHLGVIGTNWISHQFVSAALETGAYDLTAVSYSETSNGTRIQVLAMGMRNMQLI